MILLLMFVLMFIISNSMESGNQRQLLKTIDVTWATAYLFLIFFMVGNQGECFDCCFYFSRVSLPI